MSEISNHEMIKNDLLRAYNQGRAKEAEEERKLKIVKELYGYDQESEEEKNEKNEVRKSVMAAKRDADAKAKLREMEASGDPYVEAILDGHSGLSSYNSLFPPVRNPYFPPIESTIDVSNRDKSVTDMLNSNPLLQGTKEKREREEAEKQHHSLLGLNSSEEAPVLIHPTIVTYSHPEEVNKQCIVIEKDFEAPYIPENLPEKYVDLYHKAWKMVKEGEGVGKSGDNPFLCTNGRRTIGGLLNVDDKEFFLKVPMHHIGDIQKATTQEEKVVCYNDLGKLKSKGLYGKAYTPQWYLKHSKCPYEIDTEYRDRMMGKHIKNAILFLDNYISPKNGFKKFESLPDAIQTVAVDMQVNTGHFVKEKSKDKDGWPSFYKALRENNLPEMIKQIHSKDVSEARNKFRENTLFQAHKCPEYYMKKP